MRGHVRVIQQKTWTSKFLHMMLVMSGSLRPGKNKAIASGWKWFEVILG